MTAMPRSEQAGGTSPWLLSTLQQIRELAGRLGSAEVPLLQRDAELIVALVDQALEICAAEPGSDGLASRAASSESARVRGGGQ